MVTKMRMRRKLCLWSRLTVRFSPLATAPVRSSPSRWMYGGWCSAPKALPSAWTTPLRPSDSSYRAQRSRSRSLCVATARPRLLPHPENCLRTCQLRLTRMAPDVPPCLVSETDGASLVSVTLERRTGAPDGAGGGAVVGDGTVTGAARGGGRFTGGPTGGGPATRVPGAGDMTAWGVRPGGAGAGGAGVIGVA